MESSSARVERPEAWSLALLDGGKVGRAGRSAWLVVDVDASQVRGVAVRGGPIDGQALVDLALRAMTAPRAPARAGRPRRLLAPGAPHALREATLPEPAFAHLVWSLRGLGVEVERSDTVSDVNAIRLAYRLTATLPPGQVTGAPYLERELCEAFGRLEALAPWRRGSGLLQLEVRRGSPLTHGLVGISQQTAGVVCYRSLEDAGALYRRAREVAPEVAQREHDIMDVRAAPLTPFDPMTRARLRDAGLTTAASLPWFRHLRPREPARRGLGRRDARTMLRVLQALVGYFAEPAWARQGYAVRGGGRIAVAPVSAEALRRVAASAPRGL